jgi:26S proteasome regulatory subunit N2
MIHKGNKAQAMAILQPYLGQNEATNSPYCGGGAFYALGLIHANQYNPEVMNTLIQNMMAIGQNDIICHGISLAYGLVGMARADESIYAELKNIMLTDNAIRGESAAISIGLLMLGSGNEDAIKELLTYSHETEHEKIIRAISLALAFIMFGKEEASEFLFEQMVSDKDAIIRYGAMYLKGMAYVGTDNKAAISRLLQFSVSDVDNDVRRAAVTNLGFVLAKSPEKLTKIVAQLADSYNPYVRYGAAMAIGIGCAGTAMKEAANLLIPILGDSSDFVRSGAIIALSLVMIQATKGIDEKVDDIKKYYDQVYKDKHEDILCKFSAIVGKGIMDVGGRNCTIRLMSRFGTPKMASVVGLAVFCQHWYWFPYINFLSLSLSPTALFGLNADLKLPASYSVVSNAKPSKFAYPPNIVRQVANKPTTAATAELSTTGRAKAKAKQKDKKPEKMSDIGPKDVKKEEAKKEEKKQEKPEPDFEIIQNGRRILPHQRSVLTSIEDEKARYRSVLRVI